MTALALADQEKIFRALDGHSYPDGAALAAAVFAEYQRQFEPTIPLGEFGTMLMRAVRRHWVTDEPGDCQVHMPAPTS